uniref:Uncharacterized protein n=1 Tax=Daphnia magna TaxID=35525 RepID=A0A0N8D7U9_9CRUS
MALFPLDFPLVFHVEFCFLLSLRRKSGKKHFSVTRNETVRIHLTEISQLSSGSICYKNLFLNIFFFCIFYYRLALGSAESLKKMSSDLISVFPSFRYVEIFLSADLSIRSLSSLTTEISLLVSLSLEIQRLA